ncbi:MULTISPECIES: hypothetical protein [Bradyrhizobium]|uniref:hypothetical protein n=1 Tax=Bradyrhizobium TaxID=374 RepID=UPI00216A1985|nr:MULTISPECIES: hypothetical protein [Bradyrhizobium]MCS3932079.1 hypothetical protein [Bradyrhizobium elkanii]MCS3972637.1 hypothetical protein [Bradyrhizobium japonicum]
MPKTAAITVMILALVGATCQTARADECFCAHNSKSGATLRGCEVFKAPTDFYSTAVCTDPETGKRSQQILYSDWTSIEDGADGCRPCQRARQSNSDVPRGQVPPSTPPNLPSAPLFAARAVQGVYWNTFFTRGTEKDAKLNAKTNASYTMVLDLSAYNYRQIRATNAAGTEVSPAVQRYLANAPQEPVELKIRPVPVTPQILIDDLPVKSMTIDRKKLLRQQNRSATAENRLIASFRSGKMEVADFSSAIAAGHVPFQVRLKDATTAGCAVIAFTIWDVHNNPIDHLLQTVAIADGTTVPNCTINGEEALKGGFGTLLDPAFGVGPGSDEERPIRAALHVFEIKTTQAQKQSFAIFIDKTQYSAPPAGRPDGERGVYAWRLGHWLSDYIGEPNGLPFQIDLAWKAADRGSTAAYAQVANELATKIFGAEPGDEAKADGAKAALKAISEAEFAPVVLARLVGSENQKLYMPLGLIAGAGNTRGVSRPITVLQPLPEERYGPGRCIRTWSFGVSRDTKDLVDARTQADLAKLNAAQPATGEAWLTRNSSLREYLSTSASSSDTAGEGLVLLAHHDGQGIYIETAEERVLPGELRRKYSRGSIALLASCATGSPSSDLSILTKLNSNGMDAMIVSPFKVRLDYGARLALEFTNIVMAHRRNGTTPTLAQIFSEATAATTHHFANRDRQQRLEDMALEFVLVGDPYVRLCPP